MNVNLNEYSDPEVQLRWDRICERQRGTHQIRNELARLLKEQRDLELYFVKDPLVGISLTYQNNQVKIETLRWVLNHENQTPLSSRSR